MAAVGWRTIHPGPRTTKPQPGHKKYPYLLADLADIRPGEVVCADITYIPVRGGFFHLVAVMDWASRFVLSWELDNTMEVGFCVSAMEEALRRYGAPSISNTDQGSRRPLAVGRSPARRSCGRCWTRGCGSTWTARPGGWTTGSSSVCGGR